jgi:hypothetical protein
MQLHAIRLANNKIIQSTAVYPSTRYMKKFQSTLRKLLDFEPKKLESVLGHEYYMLDIGRLVALVGAMIA